MTEEQFWSGLGDYQERILNIITNLSSKTYVGIVNLKNKQTWWSQRVVDFFGLEKDWKKVCLIMPWRNLR